MLVMHLLTCGVLLVLALLSFAYLHTAITAIFKLYQISNNSTKGHFSNQLYKAGFDDWWNKQKQIQNKIEKTCKKYGSSLRQNIKPKQLMFDPINELLFCRNAKINIK